MTVTRVSPSVADSEDGAGARRAEGLGGPQGAKDKEGDPPRRPWKKHGPVQTVTLAPWDLRNCKAASCPQASEFRAVCYVSSGKLITRSPKKSGKQRV